MFDFLDGFKDGLQSFATTTEDLFGSVANVYKSFDNISYQRSQRELNTALQMGQLDLQKTQTYAALDIAKLQAQGAIKNAQAQSAFSDYNLNQTMANIQRQLAGGGGGSNLMLWLTVAGVGIALFQVMKK